MIKAVFFDLYNTLVRFWPPVEEVQLAACSQLGLRVSKEGLLHGYALADQFFNQENARQPLAQRSPEERHHFFSRYEQYILRGAGLEVSEEVAGQVWREVQKIPTRLALFDDALPALEGLRARGLTLGGISNLRRNMPAMAGGLGLEGHLDFIVTSEEAGAEKPHPPIFRAALQRAQVEPSQAVHVGDQYESDVLGAQGVGIRAVLLDRHGHHPLPHNTPRIRTLTELEGWLEQEGLL